MNQSGELLVGYSVCSGMIELRHTGEMTYAHIATVKTVMQGFEILLWQILLLAAGPMDQQRQICAST